jgi:hypothetical protein
MDQDGTNRRRWIGGVSLGLALVMVIFGEGWIRGRARPATELFFWLGCFGLTGVAIVAAMLDFRALRSRILSEQRELVETTLKEIRDDARRRPGRNGSSEISSPEKRV